MMLEALLSDLLELQGVELFTTRDPRLPPLVLPVKVEVLRSPDDIWGAWQRCIDESDAVWPIAPESGGMLEKFSTMAQSKKLLGCTPSTIRITASKRATALHLATHGVPVVPTYLSAEAPANDIAWVAKPDDGVGCEDTRRFIDYHALIAWLGEGRQGSHVIQPWLEGEAASLSMICHDGKAQLLSCNHQLIDIADGSIHYRGSLLNGMASHWDKFDVIARQVASVLPGLVGYVGVDVIVSGDEVIVLEINPRLTTSYVGLHRAIGGNPAGLVLDLLYNGRWSEPDRLQRNVVEVRVDD